jgi:transposase
MAKTTDYILTTRQRHRRYFSEDFIRRKVSELDRKLVRICEICNEYEVSRQTVYKWIYKFSKMQKKEEHIRIETESDTRKLQEIKERIKELERIIGQKQLLLDFQEKVIELAEEEYKVDIKKKYGVKPLPGSGTIVKNKQ